MRWLADECVPAPLVASLRAAGHDVVYLAETDAGISDEEATERALAGQRLLLTEDKDFGDLVFRQRHHVPGLVLLRLNSEEHAVRWARLQAAILRFGEELFGRYTVIEVARFRTRPLQPPGML